MAPEVSCLRGSIGIAVILSKWSSQNLRELVKWVVLTLSLVGEREVRLSRVYTRWGGGLGGASERYKWKPIKSY